MFKGVDVIFLSGDVFGCCFHVLLRVFHVTYLNTYEFFQNMIWNDILSYVVIKVELVCKLS